MKKIYFLSLAFVFTISSFTQENQSEYLLRDSKAQLSTFYAEIAPATSFSRLNDQRATVVDLSGGLILNNRYTVSFFFSGSPKINRLPIPDEGTEEYDRWIDAGVKLYRVLYDADFLYVKFRHAGLRLGYQHYKGKPVFWRTNLGIGFLGGLDLTEDKTFFGLFDNPVYKKQIFTLEPSAGIAINLLKWWRVNLDIGYRIVNVDTRIISAANVDSFTYKFSFAFGNFSLK